MNRFQIIYTYFVLFALLIGNGAFAASLPDGELQGYIVRLETGLQGAGDEGGPLSDRLSYLKEAVYALNDIKRYEFAKDFWGFHEACNNAALQITLLQSLIDEIRERPDYSVDDMRLLDEFATLNWYFLTAHFIVRPELKKYGEEVFYDCSAIQKAIADKTEFDSVKNDPGLCEMGLKSRKWLAVYRLQQGPYDRPSQDEYLIPLKQYMDLLNKNGLRSDEIDETVADARCLECQIVYALHEYDRCLELVDEYFGETLKNLTPESPESKWTGEALVAFDFKIQSLATPIRPDIFDKRMLMEKIVFIRDRSDASKPVASALRYGEERKKLAMLYPVSKEGAVVLREALGMAKRFASFGDRHADPNSHYDIMKKRWALVFDIQNALDLQDERIADMARLVKEYPRRFSSYRLLVSTEKMKKNSEERNARKERNRILLNVVMLIALVNIVFQVWNNRKRKSRTNVG